jgi:AraC-like DNA-binding protein
MRALDAPPLPNRVLPDGCADLIIEIANEPRLMVVGAMRTAAVVPVSGAVDYFGIRFRPGGALPFLDTPLAELTDRGVPLDAMWGRAADALADILASAAPHARVAHAERLLRERLRPPAREPRGDERLAAEAVRLMRRARGRVGIGEVALALGVGERRLERAFGRSVGLAPKVLGRVLRLGHAVQVMDRMSGGTAAARWTAVAFEAGYADQSHLIREFRALAGVTPAQLLAERQGVGFVQYDDVEADYLLS